MPPRISAVLNTLDEERTLPWALRSLRPWVDEIIVVDMHSTDRTREIALAAGCEVHLHDRMGYVEPARAFAVAQAHGDWVLVLDADELVTPRLAATLREVAASGASDVVAIPRLNWMLGASIQGGGWGAEQDRQTRFFRAGALEFDTRIHSRPRLRPGGRLLALSASRGTLVHFNYLDSSHFLRKLDRYTSIEARLAQERGEVPSAWNAITRSAREFAARYWWHGGWRDGWRGFALAGYMAGYRFATEMKLYECGEQIDESRIFARHAAEVERLLGGTAER